MRGAHTDGVPLVGMDYGVPVKPAIVAFCGLQGHGKSTAARWLAEQHGFMRTSFADPIRRGLTAMAHVTPGVFDHALKNKPLREFGGLTPREAMERLGDWGRELRPGFWIAAWARAAGDCGDIITIDDARYDLEVEQVAKYAARRGKRFALVTVTRSGWPVDADAPAQTSHSSNRVPVAPDGVLAFEVQNNGTYEELGRQVERGLQACGIL